MIHVQNPHSVLAALQSRPKDVQEVLLRNGQKKESLGDIWKTVFSLAEKNRIPITSRSEDPRTNANAGGGRSGFPGARIKPRLSVAIEELFQKKSDGSYGVWLALDCLQDPQNVGAIFRSAAFFGVQGILMTQERSVDMTPAVYDVSSGGVETVPFCILPNLQRGFEKAKDAGLWILGTSEHAKESLKTVKKDRDWLIVLGNEEAGIRRLTQDTCDVMCTIPQAKGAGAVTSLNVSVATGILLAALS